LLLCNIRESMQSEQYFSRKGTFCVFWKLGVALAPRFLRPCTYWEHWYDWEPWEFVYRCHYANANINGRVDLKKKWHSTFESFIYNMVCFLSQYIKYMEHINCRNSFFILRQL
jgi:hypothetical protein